MAIENHFGQANEVSHKEAYLDTVAKILRIVYDHDCQCV